MYPSESRKTDSLENFSRVTQREEERRKEQPGFRPQHIERFRQLYQDQFGVWLSEAEAQRQLRSLVTVVRYQRMNRPASQGTE